MVDTNPNNYRCKLIRSSKSYTLEHLIEEFGYNVAKTMINNALDEMNAYGTDSVRFDFAGVIIYRKN